MAYSDLAPPKAAAKRRSDAIAVQAASAAHADLFITRRKFLYEVTWDLTSGELISWPKDALPLVSLYLRTQGVFITYRSPEGTATDQLDKLLFYWVGARELLPSGWRWFGGDAQRTVALARAAQRPRTLTPAVHALAAIREAQGHALGGNAAGCQSKLCDAHRLLDDAGEQIAADPFDALGAHYATHAYVTVHEAQCWSWLSRHDTAAKTMSCALASWPAALHRDAGLHHARLARSRAANRQPDRAACDGIAALEIARSTNSARIMLELGTLDRQLADHATLPASREFRDAYAAATSAAHR